MLGRAGAAGAGRLGEQDTGRTRGFPGSTLVRRRSTPRNASSSTSVQLATNGARSSRRSYATTACDFDPTSMRTCRCSTRRRHCGSRHRDGGARRRSIHPDATRQFPGDRGRVLRSRLCSRQPLLLGMRSTPLFPSVASVPRSSTIVRNRAGSWFQSHVPVRERDRAVVGDGLDRLRHTWAVLGREPRLDEMHVVARAVGPACPYRGYLARCIAVRCHGRPSSFLAVAPCRSRLPDRHRARSLGSC